jgi:hypothetical protein
MSTPAAKSAAGDVAVADVDAKTWMEAKEAHVKAVEVELRASQAAFAVLQSENRALSKTVEECRTELLAQSKANAALERDNTALRAELKSAADRNRGRDCDRAAAIDADRKSAAGEWAPLSRVKQYTAQLSTALDELKVFIPPPIQSIIVTIALSQRGTCSAAVSMSCALPADRCRCRCRCRCSSRGRQTVVR